MDIPVELFITWNVLAFALGIMGIIMAMKKIDGSPFIIIFAGILMFSQLAITEDIQYFGTGGSGITQVWNQQALTGQVSVHNGTGNTVIRGEHVTSSSSQLANKLVNCMELAVGRTGSPPITTPVILGVFNGDVVNSIAVTKYEFGRINVTEIQFDKQSFKRCNTVSDYLITSGDRIGLMYRAGDASNVITLNENSNNPFDGTVTVISTFNDASNTWSNVNANDMSQVTLTLEGDAIPTSYQFNQNDTWLYFILFGVLFVFLGVMMYLAKW